MSIELQIKEFEAVMNKTVSDYRIKDQLIHRRNQLLLEIKNNNGIITPDFEHRLLELLDAERVLIGVLSDEGNLEIAEVESALETLEKVKYQPGLFPELDKLNINYYDLMVTARICIRILNEMKKRLHKIERRILMEEGLIGDPTPEHFKIYLSVWEQEIREEEKLRFYVVGKKLGRAGKILERVQKKIGNKLNNIKSPVGVTIGSGVGGGLSASLTTILPTPLNYVGLAITLCFVAIAFTIFLKDSWKGYSKYVDLESEDVVRQLKKRNTLT
ncbi:MAG: hypothetical protein IH934_05710 [Nanoarchaeota archaeon]|nr:hypothetical protein [Nanoarchaeota archaeon]